MNRFRYAIVGAGIAGASAAYRLAEALGSGKDIVIIEREDQPGYHSTGRSAAVYTETYGPPVIRALTAGSRPFFDNPPEDFCDVPLLHPLGMLLVGTQDRQEKAAQMFAQCRQLTPTVELLANGDIAELVPILRPEWRATAVYEPDAMSMDVAALHTGYLKSFRALGGTVLSDMEVVAFGRDGDNWILHGRHEDVLSSVVINASGAWADDLAELAKTKRLGLQPKRRTAIVFKPTNDYDSAAWPMVNDIDETFYFKPDAGRILASPEEETPMPPCDVQPDEYDIAITVDRLEKATTLDIPRIDNAWAGLRSFFPDGVPAVGFDAHAPGFFWLAGQGGYGITTSDAMARVAAAQILELPIPEDLAEMGVDARTLSPERFD